MKTRYQFAMPTTVLIVRESFRSYGLNGNLETAATLAYYGFLSLMPLLLLVIFLLSLVLRSGDSMQAMEGLLKDIFPTFNLAVLQDLQKLAGTQVWGLLSVFVLIWSMTPFAGALRSAMRRIFKSDRLLPFVKGKLLDISAILLMLILFVGTVAWRTYASAREAEGIPMLAFAKSIEVVLGIVLTTLVMCLFYAVFAPVRLRATHLLAGAMTATVLLSVMRPLFGLFLQYNPNYGYAFGSLKAIFLLLIWVYYTFAVILLGAEIMANARRKEALLLRGFFLGTKRTRGAERLVASFSRAVPKGEVLFREGDTGHEMFYVVTGAVALKKGEHVLFVAKEGTYFGEMSMLIGAPRSATAIGDAEETRLVAISEANFDTILRENPTIVRSLLKELASRLKTTNEQLEKA